MKSSGQTISAVWVILAVLSVTGCEEQNKPDTKSEVKKHQLIATENMQLKKELQQHKDRIERERELLEKCLEGKKALEERWQAGVDEFMKGILGSIAEENEEIKKLVRKLQVQVQQLKKELQEDKKPTPSEPIPLTRKSM